MSPLKVASRVRAAFSYDLYDHACALRVELVRQWLINHPEHCGAPVPPWPHDGICPWPMPQVLLDALTAITLPLGVRRAIDRWRW
jgi:hypothetical protein